MKRYFYTAVACRIFATVSALTSGLVYLKLFSHYFSPDLYGVVLVALQIMNYLPLLDGGFRTTINRNLLAQSNREEQLRMIHFGQVFCSWLALVIIGVAVALMLGYAYTPNVQQSGQPLIFFLTLGVVCGLTVLGSTQMSLLVGLQAQTSVFLLSGLNWWLMVGALWIGLRAGAGVWAFVGSWLAGWAGTYPVTLWLLRKKVPGLRIFNFETGATFWRYFHQHKAEAWACVRSQVSLLLLFSVDVVIVGLICTAREAAIYGVLSRLFGIVRGFLQATCDVAWPLVAQRGMASQGMTVVLWRLNGWLYGSTTGALCLTAIPFLNWYMGKDWTPSPTLVTLVTLRFIITGVCSPAAYFLFGLGEFKLIARYIERELAVAVVLGSLLGKTIGANGVALGFLVATVCGTLAPVILAYARAMQLNATRLMVQVWWRMLVGLVTSFATTFLFLRFMGQGLGIVVTGLAAAGLALSLALGISLVRYGRAKAANRTEWRWSEVLYHM